MDEVSTGLHWLTFSTRRSWDVVCDLLPGGWGEVEYRGGFNQPRSICHESGARVYFGNPREEQPVVVNLSGEVCEQFAAEGITWASAAEGSITRYDVALDLAPAEQARRRMIQMRKAFKQGHVETRVQTFEEYRNDEGWTWYFGDRSSERFLRVYDRRGPLRMEFQIRPDRGIRSKLPGFLSSHGTAAIWRSHARNIIFPFDWFKQLLKGSTVEWQETAHTENEFMKVLDQVKLQFGQTIWALQELGVKFEELAREPQHLNGRELAKFKRWSHEAESNGYDGGRLREKLRCKSKSKLN